VADAVFRPRARILSILGDQLIRDEVVAILELVKNSYDADAKNVTVEIKDVTSLRGYVSITDDGHGMTPDDVRGSWMELATSTKTPTETVDESTGHIEVTPRTSPEGRTQLGEKGVGRLAALKLGRRITLITRGQGSVHETELSWDADAIESTEYLDQLRIPIDTRPPALFAGVTHGTRVLVDRLYHVWSTDLLKRVETALRRLADVDPARFSIRLVAPEAKVDAVLVPLEIGTAPYTIDGDVDANGTFVGGFRVMNYLGPKPIEVKRPVSQDLVKSWAETKPKRGEPRHRIEKPTRVGPFHISVVAYDLDLGGLRQAGLSVSGRDQIKEVSGISISRDDFRILPYGEKRDDWLELNQRRVNDPTLRLSNNQIVGTVRITRSDNPELRDKTNREGLIENEAYTQLQSLVLMVLSILEVERFKVRPRRKDRLTGEDVGISIDNARKLAVGEGRLLKAIEEVQSKFSAWNDLVSDRHETLLQVAGIGMAAETVTHEIDRGLHLIEGGVNALIALRRVTAPPEKLDEVITSLMEHLSDLKEVVGILSPLQAAKRPRIQQLSVEKIVRNVVRLFNPDIFAGGVTATVRTDSDLLVDATRADLIQVFMNLVDNALFWLSTVDDRRLEICIRGSQKEVLVRDSGPGVKPEVAELIFEPFFTTKEEGRGLGLFIVQDILSRRGWSIELVPSDAEFRGAHFLLRFALKEAGEVSPGG
jgi:signal transduction histidine kinase